MKILKNNISLQYLLFYSLTLLSINQLFQLALVDIAQSEVQPSIALGNAMSLLTLSKIAILSISGSLIDKYGEKKVLTISSAAFVLFFLCLLLQNNMDIYFTHQLYVYSIISGILLGFVQPSMSSMTPRIVKSSELPEVNSIVQTASQLAQFIIPSIAAFLISTLLQSYYIFIIFILSLLCYIFVRKIKTVNQDTDSNFLASEEPKAKLSSIIRNRDIISLLIITAILNFSTSGTIQVILPVYLSSSFENGTSLYGYILSIYGLGMFLGSLIFYFMKKRANNISTLLVLFFIFGIVLAFSIQFIEFSIIAFNFLICGFILGIINVLFVTLLQQRTPSHLLGRVMSIQFLSSSILAPLSYSIMGFSSSVYSPTLLFWSCGLLVSLTSLILILIQKNTFFKKRKLTS